MADTIQQVDPLVIAGRSFASRLIVGTARFSSRQVMLDALAASGTEMATASIRRISLEGYSESLVDLVGGRYQLLPNTAGCATVKDAILTAQLARESLETDWVKLELIGDRETLYPDVVELVQAAERDALRLREVLVAQQQPTAAALEDGGGQRRHRQARVMAVGDDQDRRVGQAQDPDPMSPSCGLDGSP
jgi:thiazole synthase ThiGH ThiG subunit